MDAAMPSHLKGVTGKKLIEGLKKALKEHENRYGKGPKWDLLNWLLDEARLGGIGSCRGLSSDAELRCEKAAKKRLSNRR